MLRSRLLSQSRKAAAAATPPPTTTTTTTTPTTSTSHALLTRGGFFQPGSAAGMFSALPLGARVVERLRGVVRREMDGELGAQRVELPSLAATEAWVRTGRLETYGAEMFKLRDRKEATLVLSPTHEEAITEVVTGVFGTQVPRKALPVLAYQIGTKFRDEARPRYGLLRGREFLMKDLYSFHADEACAAKTYADVCASYERLLRKVAPAQARVAKVAADSGNMGGLVSHEFHFVAPIGEDTLLTCDAGSFAGNVETCTLPASPLTPSEKTDVVKLANRSFKVPPGRRVSETRLAQRLSSLPKASSEALDASAFGLLEAKDGDRCTDPTCSCGGKGTLREHKGIEVGHAFLLGTRYATALNANATPATSAAKATPLTMGCYGLGLTRIVAAAVEAPGGHDEFGIVWSPHLAPFHVAVVTAPGVSPDSAEEGFRVVSEAFGYSDALLDDRFGMSFGSKLLDAKLIGVPHILVIRSDGRVEHHPRVQAAGAGGAVATLGSMTDAVSLVKKELATAGVRSFPPS